MERWLAQQLTPSWLCGLPRTGRSRKPVNSPDVCQAAIGGYTTPVTHSAWRANEASLDLSSSSTKLLPVCRAAVERWQARGVRLDRIGAFNFRAEAPGNAMKLTRKH